MYPSFFGNYSSSFQVASNQSAKTDLEKNDLQVGIGTVSNTASSVEFSSMVHSMGLAHITFAPTSVVAARLFNSNGTKLRDVGTATVYANENFTPSTYSPSSHNFLRVSKPGNISFTPSSSTFTWNKNSTTLTANTATTLNVSCSKEYEYKGTPNYTYAYSGGEQTFTTSANAEYLLEVWGAQGGGTSYTPGGRGGYSYSLITFNSSQALHVYVGGSGSTYASNLLTNITEGGYNGGGGVKYNEGFGELDGHQWNATGGGATHIATTSGLLNTLSSKTASVLIVAGGGGGAVEWHHDNLLHQYATGGAGGGLEGITGNNTDHIPGTGGTQSSGGTTGGIFGHGGVVSTCMQGSSGGGGGWYGGGGAQDNAGGGGGSGYLKSGLKGETIAGNKSVPYPTTTGTETGHTGNGYAIITQLSY